MKRILIVEDDIVMSRMLVQLLRAEGFDIIAVHTMRDASKEIAETHYDLAILDVKLPDGSGLDICSRIRDSSCRTAVIFLTANDLEQDMVKGYELGAVDYITKPFPSGVLRHKVNAIFAMLEGSTDAKARYIYDDGLLFIDFSAMRAAMGSDSISFAPLEYRILKVFVKNKGILLTRQKLFEKLWDGESRND